jgi:hypothetical protein
MGRERTVGSATSNGGKRTISKRLDTDDRLIKSICHPTDREVAERSSEF